MLKLLIVEDEDKTRTGLRDCVQWADYGIEFSGEAANGTEALEFIQSHHVDIMITDVSMPYMDGIQLVQSVKSLNLMLKVLFISGHADIPYLKSALKLEAVDYIIKPIHLAELDASLKKLVDVFHDSSAKNQALAEVPRLREKLADALPMLRERFFLRLIQGSLQHQESILRQVQYLDLPITAADSCTALIIDAGVGSTSEELHAFEKRQLDNLRSEQAITSVIAGKYQSFFIYPSEDKLCCVVCSSNPFTYDDFLNDCGDIQAALAEISGQTPTIGIGCPSANIAGLGNSYRQATQAYEQKYFLGSGQIIHFSDIEKPRLGKSLFSSQIKDALIESIRTGNILRVTEHVGELFDKIKSSGIGLRSIQNTCLEILVLANKQLLEQKVVVSGQEDSLISWQELLSLDTLDATQSWLNTKLTETAELILGIHKSSTSSIVTLMKKSINARFHENITTHKIAEEFYITPNYVCLLFKKETGETFNDYLTGIRIEKAKELLLDPTIRVYEISDMVGFQNQFYFSKLFKKFVGVTPSEYRDRLVH